MTQVRTTKRESRCPLRATDWAVYMLTVGTSPHWLGWTSLCKFRSRGQTKSRLELAIDRTKQAAYLLNNAIPPAALRSIDAHFRRLSRNANDVANYLDSVTESGFGGAVLPHGRFWSLFRKDIEHALDRPALRAWFEFAHSLTTSLDLIFEVAPLQFQWRDVESMLLKAKQGLPPTDSPIPGIKQLTTLKPVPALKEDASCREYLLSHFEDSVKEREYVDYQDEALGLVYHLSADLEYDLRRLMIDPHLPKRSHSRPRGARPKEDRDLKIAELRNELGPRPLKEMLEIAKQRKIVEDSLKVSAFGKALINGRKKLAAEKNHG